jgi:hypothetical protein
MTTATKKTKNKKTNGGKNDFITLGLLEMMKKKTEKKKNINVYHLGFPLSSAATTTATDGFNYVEEPRQGERKKKKTEKKKNVNSCYLVCPPSAVATRTNDDNRRNCNRTFGRLLTTQESLSLKAAATECEQKMKKKKKKKRVFFVLTMEQQRSSGTHFPRKRPHSL